MSVAKALPRLRFAPLLFGTVITGVLLWLVVKAANVFLLLFIAILVSLFLRAVADVFESRLRMPSSVALLASVLMSLGALVGLITLLVPPLAEQTRALAAELPNYMTGLENQLAKLGERIPPLKEYLATEDHKALAVVYEGASQQLEKLLPKVFGLLHYAIDAFALLVMSLYLARRPADYREWLIALFPPTQRELVRDVLHEIARDLRAWITGQLLGMVILAVLTAIGLATLQVPYWLTFGIFTGAVAIVPFFGTLISTVLPALFVLASDGEPWRVISVIILGTVIHLIESNLVLPLITQNQVKLPPVLSIMSVLIFGQLLGPVGLIVAVPLLVVLTVIVRRVLVNRIYQGAADRPLPVDRLRVLRVPAPEGTVVVPPGNKVHDLIALAERLEARA
ncbi:MAG TPA: AI-2E family transporter [Gemmatimonadaceae bacterium]|nr:AI-2E family transporter [Gemmatimonadaceae bacterium]